MKAVAGLLAAWLGMLALEAAAEPRCDPLSEKPVKLEAWMSKRYEKDLRRIHQHFAEMGNTSVNLWVYPADNPSRTVAIGRCVPAYIARHALKQAIRYSGRVTHLVHQGFISSRWIGIGTSLFNEVSQNSITPDQLRRLMDESLDTPQFQALYRALTVQPEKVRAFGLMLDNPKLMREPGPPR